MIRGANGLISSGVSIASFIQLPNGKIIGRSKMGFDNDQATGINKIYKTNIQLQTHITQMEPNQIGEEYITETIINDGTIKDLKEKVKKILDKF